MRKQRAALLGLLLAFVYFTFFSQDVLAARYLPLRVLHQGVTALLLGIWLVGLIRTRRGIPRSPLDGPVIAVLGIALVSSCFGLCPRFSLERLWFPITYALAYYLLTDLRQRGWQSSLFQALFLTAGIVCLAGLFEWVAWYLGLPFLPYVVQGWPDIGGWRNPIPPVFHRLDATLGGSTPLAAYLAVLIPPGIGWAVTARDRSLRWALWAWLATVFLTQVLAFSRGGVLALGVSLPLTAAGWAAAQPQWREAFRRRLLGRARWGTRSLMLVALAAMTVVTGFWLSRSFVGRSGSTLFRFTLWRVALEIFQAHPWLGVGPANFGRALLALNDGSLPRRQIVTAHNLYLNLAAEMGLPGLLAGGWLLVAAVRAGLVRWRTAQSQQERLRITACLAALAGWGAQQVVDTFLAPTNWLPVLVLASFALVPASPASGPPRRGRRWAVAALVALALLAIGQGWMDVADYHFERSTRLAQQGEFDLAAGEAAQAGRMDAGLALYDFQRGYIHGQWALAEQNTGLMDQAIADYWNGLAQEPIWGRQTANLASLLWQQGRRAEALEWLERSVQAELDPVYLVNLGLYEEEMGQSQSAWDWYGQALALAPSWAGSGFWEASPARAAAWPQIVQRAEESAGGEVSTLLGLRTAMAWARGEDVELERLARQWMAVRPTAPEAYVWLARSLLQQGRWSPAEEAAQRAVSLAPTSAAGYAVRGCAQWRAGEVQEGMRALRTALFLDPFASQDAYACLGGIYEEQGNAQQAIWAYQRALLPRVVWQDVEVTLYGRQAGFELLPSLVHIRMGPREAAPWLALAGLYEQGHRWEEARTVYLALLAEDPYLKVARERLDRLP